MYALLKDWFSRSTTMDDRQIIDFATDAEILYAGAMMFMVSANIPNATPLNLRSMQGCYADATLMRKVSQSLDGIEFNEFLFCVNKYLSCEQKLSLLINLYDQALMSRHVRSVRLSIFQAFFNVLAEPVSGNDLSKHLAVIEVKHSFP